MSSPANRFMPASMTTYTGPVFHYTTSGGLLGSIESGSLWASAASSLNDLGEVRQGWQLIKEILELQPHSDMLDLLKGLADNPLKAQHEVFVLSASTEGDDANQWRLYADSGRGYVIGLDGAVPLTVRSDQFDPAAGSGRGLGTLARNLAAVSPWHEVLYDRSSVEVALTELLAAAETEDHKIEATSGMDDADRTIAYEALQEDVYEVLSTIAHLIKTPGFAGENEVRVVATFVWGEEHIVYRAGDHGIVGYVRLAEAPGGARRTVLRPTAPDVPLVTSLPIASVRLGPLLRPEHENTMRAFLRAKNLRHVDIATSGVPLR